MSSFRSDFFKTFLGTGLADGLRIIRAFSLPVVVAPIAFGEWRMFLVVIQYSIFFHLGSFAFLNRELPGLLATNSASECKAIQSKSIGGTLFVSVLLSLGFIILTSTSFSAVFPSGLVSILFVSIALILQQLVSFQQVVLRSKGLFGQLSMLQVFNALFALIFLITLGYLFGVTGLAIGQTITTLIVFLIGLTWVPFVRPSLDFKRYFRFVCNGVPLSALPFLALAITSITQILSAYLYGLEAAAFYGLATMLSTVVYAIPRTLNTIMYPRLLVDVAKNKSHGQVISFLKKSLSSPNIFTSVTIALGIASIDFFIELIIPDFSNATPVCHASLFGMLFGSHIQSLKAPYLALRRHFLFILTLALSTIAFTLSVFTLTSLIVDVYSLTILASIYSAFASFVLLLLIQSPIKKLSFNHLLFPIRLFFVSFLIGSSGFLSFIIVGNETNLASAIKRVFFVLVFSSPFALFSLLKNKRGK